MDGQKYRTDRTIEDLLSCQDDIQLGIDSLKKLYKKLACTDDDCYQPQKPRILDVCSTKAQDPP